MKRLTIAESEAQARSIRVAVDSVLDALVLAPTSRRADDVAVQLMAVSRFASQYASLLRDAEGGEHG